ncbi:MAG: tetratricopeptide repeat protein, partial [Myxococcales bacterium]|nr:tetratricopeptide repeat protein [Myxococcales bacterium]
MASRLDALDQASLEGRAASLLTLARGAQAACLGRVRRAQETLFVLLDNEDEMAHIARVLIGAAEIQRYRRAAAEYTAYVPVSAGDDLGEDPAPEGDESEESLEEHAETEDTADEGEQSEGLAPEEQSARVDESELAAEAQTETQESPSDPLATDGDQTTATEPSAATEPQGIPEAPIFNREAIASLEAAKETVPESILARHFLRIAYDLAGEDELARSETLETAERFPDHIPSLLQLAQDYNSTGRFLEVPTLLEPVSERIDDEAGIVSTTEREAATYHYLLGTAHDRIQERDAALAEYQLALTIDSSFHPVLWEYTRLRNETNTQQAGLDFLNNQLSIPRNNAEYLLARVELGTTLIESSEDQLQDMEAEQNQLSNARSGSPLDSRIPYYQGRIERALGHFARAQALFEEAEAIDSGNHVSTFALSDLANLQEDFESAVAHLDRLLEVDSLSASELLALGLRYRALNEGGRAILAFERAVETDPYLLEARLQLVEAQLDEGRVLELDRSIEHLQFVESLGLSSEELNVLFARVQYGRGHLAEAYERVADAMADLQAVQSAEVLYLVGRINFDMGEQNASSPNEGEEEEPTEFRTAESAFRLARGAGLDTAETRYWHGRALLAQGDHTNAAQVLRTAVDASLREQQVPPAEHYYWLARSSEASRNLQQAIEAYLGVDQRSAQNLRWALNHPDLYLRRGLLLRSANQLSFAARDFRWLRILQPESPDAPRELARTYAQMGNTEEAIDLYRRSLGLAWNQPEVHYELGMLFRHLDRISDATQSLENARDLGHGVAQPTLHKTLGYIYRDAGRNADAVAEFRLYLARDPNVNTPSGQAEYLEIMNQIRRLEGH